jgi:hypothetical protein
MVPCLSFVRLIVAHKQSTFTVEDFKITAFILLGWKSPSTVRQFYLFEIVKVGGDTWYIGTKQKIIE